MENYDYIFENLDPRLRTDFKQDLLVSLTYIKDNADTKEQLESGLESLKNTVSVAEALFNDPDFKSDDQFQFILLSLYVGAHLDQTNSADGEYSLEDFAAADSGLVKEWVNAFTAWLYPEGEPVAATAQGQTVVNEEQQPSDWDMSSGWEDFSFELESDDWISAYTWISEWSKKSSSWIKFGTVLTEFSRAGYKHHLELYKWVNDMREPLVAPKSDENEAYKSAYDKLEELYKKFQSDSLTPPAKSKRWGGVPRDYGDASRVSSAIGEGSADAKKHIEEGQAKWQTPERVTLHIEIPTKKFRESMSFDDFRKVMEGLKNEGKAPNEIVTYFSEGKGERHDWSTGDASITAGKSTDGQPELQIIWKPSILNNVNKDLWSSGRNFKYVRPPGTSVVFLRRESGSSHNQIGYAIMAKLWGESTMRKARSLTGDNKLEVSVPKEGHQQGILTFVRASEAEGGMGSNRSISWNK